MVGRSAQLSKKNLFVSPFLSLLSLPSLSEGQEGGKEMGGIP